MKTAATGAALCALCCSAAQGFVVPAVPVPAASTGRSTVAMSASGPSGRAAFIKQSVASVASVAGLVTFTQAASAAKYFGDKNDYPEVMKPSNAIKDEEGLKQAQGRIDEIKKLLDTAQEIKADLAANDQVLLSAKLRKSFDFSKIRESMNQATLGVFDEDTQRGTDRLIRVILQDVIELEDGVKLKKGAVRNKRRIELVNKKLDKVIKGLEELISFY